MTYQSLFVLYSSLFNIKYSQSQFENSYSPPTIVTRYTFCPDRFRSQSHFFFNYSQSFISTKIVLIVSITLLDLNVVFDFLSHPHLPGNTKFYYIVGKSENHAPLRWSVFVVPCFLSFVSCIFIFSFCSTTFFFSLLTMFVF